MRREWSAGFRPSDSSFPGNLIPFGLRFHYPVKRGLMKGGTASCPMFPRIGRSIPMKRLTSSFNGTPYQVTGVRPIPISLFVSTIRIGRHGRTLVPRKRIRKERSMIWIHHWSVGNGSLGSFMPTGHRGRMVSCVFGKRESKFWIKGEPMSMVRSVRNIRLT